jgi:hypothetical protein
MTGTMARLGRNSIHQVQATKLAQGREPEMATRVNGQITLLYRVDLRHDGGGPQPVNYLKLIAARRS